jgi:hypothetical protein
MCLLIQHLLLRDVSNDPLTRERRKKEQELTLLCSKLVSEEEAENMPVSYFMKDKVLICKWRPPVAGIFSQ